MLMVVLNIDYLYQHLQVLEIQVLPFLLNNENIYQYDNQIFLIPVFILILKILFFNVQIFIHFNQFKNQILQCFFIHIIINFPYFLNYLILLSLKNSFSLPYFLFLIKTHLIYSTIQQYVILIYEPYYLDQHP